MKIKLHSIAKKHLQAAIAVTAVLLGTSAAFAQDVQKRYSISALGMYGWNQTWKSHGGVDIIGYLPVSRHFEASAAMELHTPKTFAVTATASPKFKLPVGEIFIDGTIHYRQMSIWGTADLNLAASVGYRMDYVSVQIGLTPHFTLDLEQHQHITEPINMLYRLSVNVRPCSSRWNAGAGVANYTDFEYERTCEPMFFINGHFDINERFSIPARLDIKPAGAFHLTAQFWGISFRTGVKYTF